MNTERRRLLLVIADSDAQQRIGRGLREHGYGVFLARDEATAQKVLLGEPIDLVILEQSDPEAPTSALPALLSAGPTVIVIGSGRGPAQRPGLARAALAAGAYDYL